MQLKLEYNSNGGMDRYINSFEYLCENIKKSEEPLSEKKQILFLNIIRDRDYDGINYQCDNILMSSTILKLQYKKIKL